MTTRKLTPAEQDEVVRLMPYAAKVAMGMAPRDDEAVSEAHLALCQAVLECPPEVPTAERVKWIGHYVHDAVYDYLRRTGKDEKYAKSLDRIREVNDYFITQEEKDDSKPQGKHPRGRRPVAPGVRPLGYTPFRPLSVHDVIARLPAHLQPVALARWTDKRRRKPWAAVAQEENLTVSEARARLEEARGLARTILNDEATSDVLYDDDPADNSDGQ